MREHFLVVPHSPVCYFLIAYHVELHVSADASPRACPRLSTSCTPIRPSFCPPCLIVRPYGYGKTDGQWQTGGWQVLTPEEMGTWPNAQLFLAMQSKVGARVPSPLLSADERSARAHLFPSGTPKKLSLSLVPKRKRNVE